MEEKEYIYSLAYKLVTMISKDLDDGKEVWKTKDGEAIKDLGVAIQAILDGNIKYANCN